MTKPSGGRFILAGLANLVVPGAGLILLRREWLGLLMSLLFGIFGQVALAGILIVPAGVPRWLTWSASIGAIGVWTAGQVVLGMRIRWLRSDEARSQFESLFNDSRAAASRGDDETARAALAGALAIDDEDLEASAAYARLLMPINRRSASRMWRRVAALDKERRFAAEIEAFDGQR